MFLYSCYAYLILSNKSKNMLQNEIKNITFEVSNLSITLFFKNYFFKITQNELWENKHLWETKHLSKEIWPDPHPVYNIYKPIDLKLLTRLRLGLSHLNKHRFSHNFENCVNPLCTCSLEAETSHFFLHCHYFHSIRFTWFNELCEIEVNLPILAEDKFLNIILYGSSHFSDSQN